MDLEEGLVEHVIEEAKQTKSRLDARDVARNFREKVFLTKGKKCERDLDFIECQINRLRLHIPRLEIDFETRVRMFLALGYKINDSQLETLQESGDVVLDETKRIKVFKAKDGSFELERVDVIVTKEKKKPKKVPPKGSKGPSKDPKISDSRTPKSARLIARRGSLEKPPEEPAEPKETSNKSPSIPLSQEETTKLIDFVIDKLNQKNSPLFADKRLLAYEFHEKCNIQRAKNYAEMAVRKLCSYMLKTDTFDTEAKVKVVFALSHSANENEKKEIEKYGDVEFDKRSRITKFTSKSDDFSLEGNHDPRVISAVTESRHSEQSTSDQLPDAIPEVSTQLESTDKSLNEDSAAHDFEVEWERPADIQPLNESGPEEVNAGISQDESLGNDHANNRVDSVHATPNSSFNYEEPSSSDIGVDNRTTRKRHLPAETPTSSKKTKHTEITPPTAGSPVEQRNESSLSIEAAPEAPSVSPPPAARSPSPADRPVEQRNESSLSIEAAPEAPSVSLPPVARSPSPADRPVEQRNESRISIEEAPEAPSASHPPAARSPSPADRSVEQRNETSISIEEAPEAPSVSLPPAARSPSPADRPVEQRNESSISIEAASEAPSASHPPAARSPSPADRPVEQRNETSISIEEAPEAPSVLLPPAARSSSSADRPVEQRNESSIPIEAAPEAPSASHPPAARSPSPDHGPASGRSSVEFIGFVYGSDNEEEEEKDIRSTALQYLEMFERVVEELKLPQLKKMKCNIKARIEQLKTEQKGVWDLSDRDIFQSVENAMNLILSNRPEDATEENSITLQSFLTAFRSAAFTLASPKSHQYLTSVAVREREDYGRLISNISIRKAFTRALRLVLP